MLKQTKKVGSCVHALLQKHTSRKITAKKCIKKCDVLTELQFCSFTYIFLFFHCRHRRKKISMPTYKFGRVHPRIIDLGGSYLKMLTVKTCGKLAMISTLVDTLLSW